MPWVLIAVAVALLLAATATGVLAIRRQRRTQNGRGMRVLASILVILGWIAMLAGLLPIAQDVASNLAGDTIAGTARPTAPGLVPAGLPTTTTSAKPAAPDPLAALRVGDCVEVPMDQTTDPKTGQPTWRAGSPAVADCDSLDANYRVVQTGAGECTGNLYKLETSRHDKSGNLIYHLCLAYDWRVGVCYDTTQMDEPLKVDCGTAGAHIVQVTAVLEDTREGAGCPRDGQGAVWVVWDKRALTVCFRGGDEPGR
ncbi:LppU/SCO3897 family protein [Nocardia huaxiensis]|uniref:Uncharacterized protein n=1 Tax=Nocardia huaxiensis TaxID=2755382 RepID=A0A7D6VHC0_9NOCA|nr:hypothetical protein [Nocardia huaxiensis]QLY29690.1 hypothetical protein H0264_31365 [Nocardia huaxiensis]UFS96735.1 hypothetical protein LPY97_02015 [Nocardia huaxiensis]